MAISNLVIPKTSTTSPLFNMSTTTPTITPTTSTKTDPYAYLKSTAQSAFPALFPTTTSTAPKLPSSGLTMTSPGQTYPLGSGPLTSTTAPKTSTTSTTGTSGLVPLPSSYNNPNASFQTMQGSAPVGYDTSYNGGVATSQNTSQNNSQFSSYNNATGPNDPFATMVKNLGDASNQGSPLVQQAGQGLISLAGQNAATSGPALAAYNKAVADKLAFEQELAKKYGGIENTPIPLEFQQGREQVLGRQAASQEAALQNAINQQQTAIGYQLQGQQNQMAGYNQAGGLGNTAQGLQQSGLTSAAGLAQPTQVSPGNSLVNPVNANEVYSGLGGYVNFQNLQNNLKQSQTYGSQAQALQTSLGQADNAFNQLTSVMDKYGINPNSIPALNQAQQWFQSHVTDPGAFTAYKDAYTAFQGSLASIIQTGAASGALTPTESSSMMASVSAGNLSIPQMQQLYEQLKLSGQGRLAPLQQQAQGSYNLGTQPNFGQTSTGGSSSGSVGSSWDNII